MSRVPSKVSATLLALVVTLLTSCASVLSDNSYDVAINSTPSNASFTITDREGEEISSGTTPAIVHLNASSGIFTRAEYMVLLRQTGYGDVQKVLRPTLDRAYFGNLLLHIPGLIGAFVVDPLTGAMYTLPQTLNADLPPGSTLLRSDDPLLDDTEVSLPQLPTVKAVDNAIEKSIKGITP